MVDENTEEVDVKGLEVKDELCPLLWDGDILKTNVRNSLARAAKKFIEFLGIDVKVKDVILTGSMANYNWHEDSDIDVHVIIDHRKIDADKELVAELFAAKKNIWNSRYSIKIKGHDVEMYVQDPNETHYATGIYSLAKSQWLKQPARKNMQLDMTSAKIKASALMAAIDGIDDLKDEEKKINKIERIKDKLRKMRAAGLGSPASEFSPENLAFKIIRKSGYLAKMMKLNTNAFNSYFSLNEVKSPRFEYGCLMAFFNIPLWERIISVVDKEDIYEGEGGFGLERDPHVTVLFGFHDDKVDPKQLKADVETMMAERALTFQLGEASIFDNPLYDVLKFDIVDSSGMLAALNAEVSKRYENTNTYPDYHPHATIAYVKKGKGKGYADMINRSELRFDIIPDKMVYSKPPGPTKFFWRLDKDANFLEIEEGLDGMTPQKLEVIKDFISFTKQKLGIQERAFVSLTGDRSDVVRTTAAYSPMESKNFVRCNGRALIDILRSIGHEMVHNKQREAGVFKAGEAVQNIGGVAEDQANAIAGILIKDFTHNHGYDYVYDI